MTTAYVGQPDVAALLAYMQLDENNYDTADAQDALDAALEVQASLCVVDPYTTALAQAACAAPPRSSPRRAHRSGRSTPARSGPCR